MSRVLNIGNIRALRLQGTLYGWHAWEVRNDYCYARSTSRYRVLTPGPSEVASGLVLEIDGPVYIANAAILTDYDTFAVGGYLGTVSGTTTAERGRLSGSGTFVKEDSRSVAYSYLGLVPGPYTGGLYIDGLNVPAPNVWEAMPSAGEIEGYRKMNRAVAFRLNNRNYYIWNHQTDYLDGDPEGTVYHEKNLYPGMIMVNFSAGHTWT